MTELITKKVDKVSTGITSSQNDDGETKSLMQERADKRKITSAENLKKARETKKLKLAALKEMKAHVPAKPPARKRKPEPESESEESEEDEDDESESESEDEDDDYSDDDEPMERPVLQRQVGYYKQPLGKAALQKGSWGESPSRYSSGRPVGRPAVRKEIVLTARGRPKKEPKLTKKEQARLDAIEQMVYTIRLEQEKAQSVPKKAKAKKAKKVKSDRGSTTINVVTPGATVPTKSSASASMAQSAIAF